MKSLAPQADTLGPAVRGSLPRGQLRRAEHPAWGARPGWYAGRAAGRAGHHLLGLRSAVTSSFEPGHDAFGWVAGWVLPLTGVSNPAYRLDRPVLSATRDQSFASFSARASMDL